LPPFEPREVAQESVTHVEGPRGQPLLLLTRPIGVGADRGTLSVGEDLSNLRRQLFEFRLMFLALSSAVFAITLMMQRREIKVALGPIERARDSVLRMREGGAPLATPDAPDEIRPLLDEIHRLMAYVDRRLQQSRTSIGNLSHALKTPLAGVFRLLEDARLGPHRELVQQLREQARPSARGSSASSARPPGRRSPEPEQLRRARGAAVPGAVARQIHSERQLSIEWHAPEQRLPYDREDLLELIGNLADNACKWSATRVCIDLREQAGLVLTVADDVRAPRRSCSFAGYAWAAPGRIAPRPRTRARDRARHRRVRRRDPPVRQIRGTGRPRGSRLPCRAEHTAHRGKAGFSHGCVGLMLQCVLNPKGAFPCHPTTAPATSPPCM
jgi:signal transduction histidine kinase